MHRTGEKCDIRELLSIGDQRVLMACASAGLRYARIIETVDGYELSETSVHLRGYSNIMFDTRTLMWRYL
jgi:hypothetical protein